jgi:hypothetical protein
VYQGGIQKPYWQPVPFDFSYLEDDSPALANAPAAAASKRKATNSKKSRQTKVAKPKPQSPTKQTTTGTTPAAQRKGPCSNPLCGVTSCAQWRTGPHGEVICNACSSYSDRHSGAIRDPAAILAAKQATAAAKAAKAAAACTTKPAARRSTSHNNSKGAEGAGQQQASSAAGVAEAQGMQVRGAGWLTGKLWMFVDACCITYLARMVPVPCKLPSIQVHTAWLERLCSLAHQMPCKQTSSHHLLPWTSLSHPQGPNRLRRMTKPGPAPRDSLASDGAHHGSGNGIMENAPSCGEDALAGLLELQGKRGREVEEEEEGVEVGREGGAAARGSYKRRRTGAAAGQEEQQLQEEEEEATAEAQEEQMRGCSLGGGVSGV